MTLVTAAKVEGSGRECQDRFALIPFGSGVVAVVADGAGGTGGGAEAATTVIERVTRAVEEGRELNARGLRQLLLEIGIELDAAGAGQTTAVVVVASPRGVVGASVGDSGAWFIEQGAWRELTAGQPRKPLLGGGLAEPLTFTCDAVEGTLLLATDGVLKYARVDALLEVVRREISAEACCESIIDCARLPDGKLQDDAAIVLVRFRPEAGLVSALRAWIDSRRGSSQTTEEEFGRAVNEFERWISLVLSRGTPLQHHGADGLSHLEFEVADDGTLMLHGSIWSCSPQRLYPFEARLTLGGDRLEAYEVSFGDASSPEGSDQPSHRPVHEWMVRHSRP